MINPSTWNEMMYTQEERRVARYQAGDGHLVVDTSEIIDAPWTYETAVSHVDYNDGEWCVVEGYDAREEAEVGHEKWVEIMTDDENLPSSLVDVFLAELGTTQVIPRIPEAEWITPIVSPVGKAYVREGYVTLEDKNTITLVEEPDSYFMEYRPLINDLMIFFIHNYSRSNADRFMYPIELGRLRITVEILKEQGGENDKG